MSKISKPLVSIITVVYNGEKYLEQTINSVINQTYDSIEYIIVDGGSTDDTLNIIKKYEDRITRWISEPDKGLYDAMNKGIAMASGDLIGMINSDDWFELNAVELIVFAARENPGKKIFHGDRYDILEEGLKRIKAFHPSKVKLIFLGMTYNHPSMFIHRDVYDKANYNIELRALSDYEFVLRLVLERPELFYYIRKCYVNYRLDGISGSMSTSDAISEGFKSRKNAGLNILFNSLSVVVRILRIMLHKISSVI